MGSLDDPVLSPGHEDDPGNQRDDGEAKSGGTMEVRIPWILMFLLLVHTKFVMHFDYSCGIYYVCLLFSKELAGNGFIG